MWNSALCSGVLKKTTSGLADILSQQCRCLTGSVPQRSAMGKPKRALKDQHKPKTITEARVLDKTREEPVAADNSRVVPSPAMQDGKTFTVCVEGNIASGKTTFLEHFRKYSNVDIFEEPVKKWRNVQGQSILGEFYKDPDRWSLTLQTYVQLTMLDQHVRQPVKPLKLMERSIFSAKYCFVENLRQSGKMKEVEYIVLTEWFDWIKKHHNLHIDLIVYLQTKPETVYQRILKRSRKEEMTIPIEYLRALHNLHEQWLVDETLFTLPAPVLKLDANSDFDDMCKMYEEKKSEILCGQVGIQAIQTEVLS